MARLSAELGEFGQGYTNMNRLSDGSWNNTFNNANIWDSQKGFVPVGQNGSGGFSFGDFGSLLGAGAGLLQGFAALRQAQMAEKQLNLAKQQFGFQKGLANRNLANQAKVINNQYDNAAQVAAGMIGGKDANGNYGYTDPSIVQEYASKAREKHVDGSPV